MKDFPEILYHLSNCPEQDQLPVQTFDFRKKVENTTWNFAFDLWGQINPEISWTPWTPFSRFPGSFLLYNSHEGLFRKNQKWCPWCPKKNKTKNYMALWQIECHFRDLFLCTFLTKDFPENGV